MYRTSIDLWQRPYLLQLPILDLCLFFENACSFDLSLLHVEIQIVEIIFL